MAWLQAVPEHPVIRGKTASSTQGKTRLQQLKEDGQSPHLPEIEHGYLIAFLWDVGPTLDAGMGSRAIVSSDLQAWQQETGIDLQPWEAQLLRRLSYDYLAQHQKSEKAGCPPPFGGWNRSTVAKKIDEFLK